MYSPTGPIEGAAFIIAASRPGGSLRISSAQAFDAIISAPSTSSLPLQWSPFECELTSLRIGAREVAGRIASSISRVSGRSNSVSTSIDSPPSVISPALLHPQEPSGCRYANAPLPISWRPLVYAHLPCAMDKSSRVRVQVDERYDDRAAEVERMRACAERESNDVSTVGSFRLFSDLEIGKLFDSVEECY